MRSKIFSLLTTILMLVFLVACSNATQTIDKPSAKELTEEKEVEEVVEQDTQKEEVNNSETSINEEESEASTDKSNGESSAPQKDEISIDEQVLLDSEGIIITLKSFSTDSFFGPSLKVLVENNRDEDITVQIRNSAINDVMIEGMFSCDVVSGKKANDEITFMSSDLETAQIVTIKDIEFFFHIFNSESWDEIYNSDIVNISTSADESFAQSYDDSGFVALDQNDFKIVVKKLESEDSFWGADIYLYIENNSDKNAIIQLRDTSINGFMVDPIFSCEILAGKKAFDAITFFESDLEDNNIESINDIEFYFHVFELEGWDEIFDSELIKVTFNN